MSKSQYTDVPFATATVPVVVYGSITPEQVAIDERDGGDVVPLIVSEKTKPEGPTFKDVPFAILFLINLGVMLWLGIAVAPKGFDKLEVNMTMIEDELRKGENVSEADIAQFEEFVSEATSYIAIFPMRILLYVILPCCILAYLVAYIVTASIIRPYSNFAVQASLIGAVSLLVMNLFASAFSGAAAFIFSLLAVFAVLYYALRVWKLVPFAAVNLKVALEGVSRNCGMYFVAFVFAELSFCWLLYWIYVVVGVSILKSEECEQAHPNAQFDPDSPDYTDVCDPPAGVFLLFLLSLYWTSSVIMNTIQVTVSGVMATWCFAKNEANGCCSDAIFASLFRSLTYSFGSICFGSLLQAIVSLLRFLVESARNQRDRERDNDVCVSILLCILECLVRFLEDIIDYFNTWAYVYVGIFGYSYLESGRRVMELFRARGWTSIITDTLVGYTLTFTTLTMGLVTGGLAVIIERIVSSSHNATSDEESYVFGPLPGASWWAFGIGVIVGAWVCSVMMSVVKGAVQALIVCLADSPSELERQHPTLTKEMLESWTEVFPETIAQLRPTYNAIVV